MKCLRLCCYFVASSVKQSFDGREKDLYENAMTRLPAYIDSFAQDGEDIGVLR